MTRKTLGREFEEPHINTDTSLEDALTIVLSFVPLVGLAAIFATGIISFEGSNFTGQKERAWKVAVYGAIIQAISLTVTYVVFLQ